MKEFKVVKLSSQKDEIYVGTYEDCMFYLINLQSTEYIILEVFD